MISDRTIKIKSQTGKGNAFTAPLPAKRDWRMHQ